MNLFRQIYFHYFCKKISKKNAYDREKFEDRNVLENIIFPYILAKYNPKTILDIGREEYQKFYNEFFTGRELWTMDINPDRREFGAKNHITDDASNVGVHFESEKFDFILINGVMGWGLNDKDKIETTFSSLYRLLKPYGVMILGWNDFKDVKVTKPEQVDALKLFKPLYFKPLKNTQFKCINGEHTYNFYQK